MVYSKGHSFLHSMKEKCLHFENHSPVLYLYLIVYLTADKMSYICVQIYLSVNTSGPTVPAHCILFLVFIIHIYCL